MRRAFACLAIAASLGCGRVAHASGERSYVGLAGVLGKLRNQRSIPILLPTADATRQTLMGGADGPLFVSLRTPNPGDAYVIQVSNLSDCTSTPCTLYAIEGRRTPFSRDTGRRGVSVSLIRGVSGEYVLPYTTNVSDGTITWETASGYYRLNVKEGHRDAMMSLANSAIAGSGRGL